MTPINFGYCTLSLKPTSGTHLRLALTGTPVREFDRIRELNAATPPRPALPPVKTVLTISEAKIYRAEP
ncbi:MAG: hypothetical protein ABSB30_16190 [Terracidiphilus sp.]|jgi:hypothetical protein